MSDETNPEADEDTKRDILDPNGRLLTDLPEGAEACSWAGCQIIATVDGRCFWHILDPL